MTNDDVHDNLLNDRMDNLNQQVSQDKEKLNRNTDQEPAKGDEYPFRQPSLSDDLLLKAIFDSSQVGIAVIGGKDLTIQLANPAFRSLTPDPSVDPVGKLWMDVWESEHTFRLEPLFRHVLRTGEIIRTDRHQERFPDESVHYFSLDISPIQFHDQQAVLTVLSENTSLVQAHQRAEQELENRRKADYERRQSEERFRHLADAMPQLVWTALPDGTVDYYNQRYSEYFGIAQKEGAIWEWSPVLHPDDNQATLAAWQRAIETGEMYQVEHRVKMADGIYRWHLSRGIPTCDVDGQVTKWYGTTTDIHDYKQTEQALENREERLRRMMEASQVGIMVISPDGTIIDINDAALAMWGHTRQEFETFNLDWRSAKTTTPPEEDLEIWQTLLRDGRVGPVERELSRSDGSQYWVMVSAVQLDIHGNEVVVFMTDITERIQAQINLQDYAEKLEQRNQELEEFAFIASHDLQEPLRKIDAFGNILMSSTAEKLSDQERNYLERMRNASIRMQSMVKGLLDLSRVTTQGGSFTQVDLNQVAANVISDLEITINRNRGKVVVSNLPTLRADPVQMRQLLQNLISNGLKFHTQDHAPVVKVWAENHDDRHVTILVEDNGIGFDPEFKDKVFEPFMRLVSRSEFEGSGMGLAICRKIVTRHGGTLTASSRPGEGSVFSVKLPSKR